MQQPAILEMLAHDVHGPAAQAVFGNMLVTFLFHVHLFNLLSIQDFYGNLVARGDVLRHLDLLANPAKQVQWNDEQQLVSTMVSDELMRVMSSLGIKNPLLYVMNVTRNPNAHVKHLSAPSCSGRRQGLHCVHEPPKKCAAGLS